MLVNFDDFDDSSNSDTVDKYKISINDNKSPHNIVTKIKLKPEKEKKIKIKSIKKITEKKNESLKIKNDVEEKMVQNKINVEEKIIENNVEEKIFDPVKMLLSYQIPHVNQLCEALKNTNCVLDASDTGTGKTYTTIACCHMMKLKPFIVCPKSVINSWATVAKEMGIEIMGVVNYEKLKGCKYYSENLKIIDCPYVKKYGEKNENFIFEFPNNTIIILDEAHKCKNHKTANSKILLAMQKSGRKMMLLSATITDKIDCFRPFGVAFGLYNDQKRFKIWLRTKLWQRQVAYMNSANYTVQKMNYSNEQLILSLIHDAIFPKKGSRMKIKELGDLFPQNQILAKCYYSDDHQKVNELYNLINTALEDLKKQETKSNALGEIIRCRMRIEMIKLPIIMDLIDDALENNYSVAIFVNFRDSMHYLVNHLKEECSIINGDQTLNERQTNIDNFQKNKTKIIVSIIQAGGVGISLHDLNGRPRMSIISPSWSGTDIVQALGRIHRAGAKSPALQRIVYIANSYEEEICKSLGEKLCVLSAINDNDLVGPKIKTEKLKESGELEKINSAVKIMDDGNEEDDKPKKINTLVKKKNYVVIDDDDNEDIGSGQLKKFSLKDTKVSGSAQLKSKYKLKK